MTKVAIIGGSGYTAAELIKILLRHPHTEIVAVTSRQKDNPEVAALHPSRLTPTGSWPTASNAPSAASLTGPA
jgi:N-acetyl-gamma-glutamylphosphate reductase